MDEVILTCYTYGSLAAEHNTFLNKKLFLQNNKQTINDEEFWAVQYLKLAVQVSN